MSRGQEEEEEQQQTSKEVAKETGTQAVCLELKTIRAILSNKPSTLNTLSLEIDLIYEL